MSCNFKEQSKIVRMGGIPLWGRGTLSQAKPPPTPPPTSLRAVTAHMDGKCEPQVRDLLARITRGRGGEGGVICETVPFDNGSLDRLQTQNEDGQCHSPPLLFRQDSSNSYWWLMASFGEFI
jgi:hypothetical protein